MSRIQRLGIGNGGMDCEISYMQGKKYPNAGDIVKPVQGVSNRTLLKNPYNTLNEPIANPGARPVRITTDNRGNVFARSETMLVPGVTNDTLLKNPNNIKSISVGEKRTLSLQRIKDINNRMLPSYITENKGINEVMFQVLTMIENRQVKLITIQLLKILITKNVPVNSAHTEQRVLKALNYLDIVLTEGRRIFKENTLSPTSIPEKLRPAVTVYVNDIIKLYNINTNALPPNIDIDIQTGLSELGLLSNALTRMFEYNNSIDPSNTLSREQINSAAFASPFQAPPQEQQESDAAPPSSAASQQDEQDSADATSDIISSSGQSVSSSGQSVSSSGQSVSSSGQSVSSSGQPTSSSSSSGIPPPSPMQLIKIRNNLELENAIQEITDKHLSLTLSGGYNPDNFTNYLAMIAQLYNIMGSIDARNITDPVSNNTLTELRALYNNNNMMREATQLNNNIFSKYDFFFQQARPVQVAAGSRLSGSGRMNRQPRNSKVVLQVGKATQYRQY